MSLRAPSLSAGNRLEGFVLHHIGYATPNSDQSLIAFGRFLLSKKPELVFIDHAQGVTVRFYDLLGGPMLEFVEPLSENSPVSRFLKNHPDGGLHHLSYECSDFEQALQSMSEQGFRRITRVTVGFQGRNIAFFLPKNGDGSPLIEIVSQAVRA